jgi:hypothetical protein
MERNALPSTYSKGHQAVVVLEPPEDALDSGAAAPLEIRARERPGAVLALWRAGRQGRRDLAEREGRDDAALVAGVVDRVEVVALVERARRGGEPALPRRVDLAQRAPPLACSPARVRGQWLG